MRSTQTRDQRADQKMKYDILVSILDKICEEAPPNYAKKYSFSGMDLEKINQARARAFIHLYLKVLFGIVDFSERERVITDGSYDGGVDGYYIDVERKIIHIIQSKFRINEKNFEGKEIDLEEILSMDVNRILDGEEADEAGNQYNGKIKQLQREVRETVDIARYTYRVVILANLRDVTPAKLRLLTGGFPVEVFDFEKSYDQLVFPVVSGSYFTASDITIPIDLSSKNSGSKISYTVNTKFSECEITVLFVPILEVARIMNKYKNAILRYNPRSYLDLEGQAVNNAIRGTVLHTKTNEFALFNNGITMLSDETNINEKIGQKNKAQLRIKNPQIINGGQTSFTLSRLYEENRNKVDEVFGDKEVLLKIITLLDENSDANKLKLIDEISNATNKQTPVINADRFSNDTFHKEVQKFVFDRYGLLYERKRGEFSDGIKDGYINKNQVIERNHFWRLFYTGAGKINIGFQRKLFQRNDFIAVNLKDRERFDRLYLADRVFRRLKREIKPFERIEKDVYGKIFAYIELFLSDGLDPTDSEIDSNLVVVAERWGEFMDERKRVSIHGRRAQIDRTTGEASVKFDERKYVRSGPFERDLIEYFRSKTVVILPTMNASGAASEGGN